MRLVDMVAASDRPVVVAINEKRMFLPGAASFSTEVNECPLRYILEENVLDAMQTLIEKWPDLLKPSDRNLRVPAESLWLEWRDDSAGKCGLLLEAAPSGRSGKIRSFWEKDGQAEASQVSLNFDLDNITAQSNTRSYRLSDLKPLLSEVGDHVDVVFDEEWYEYFSHTSESIRSIARQCAELVWSDVYRILAFSRLMASKITLSEKSIDRSKLNKSRAKSNKKPLLDHIELSMDLGLSRSIGRTAHGSRSAARLHVVRGHLVRKGGKIFWRSTHLRGDSESIVPIKRTTTVR